MADSCISTKLPKEANGSLELDCALTSGGRIANDAGTLQVQHFIRDHLGSVRTIVDGSTGDVLETSDYLPFGKRWELTGGQSSQTVTDPTNRWRFSGKETQSFYNPAIPYNDFGARLHDPRTGRWLGVDPLAEKYYDLSTYMYCAGNPIRYYDSLGLKWEDPQAAEQLKRNIDKKIANLNDKVLKNQSKLEKSGLTEKQYIKRESKILESVERIENLNRSKADIDLLETDQNNIYTFSHTSGGKHEVYQQDGIVYIETSSDAISIHEITHVRQSLNTGELQFSSEGKLINPGKGLKGISDMEIEAYKMQYSYDLSFPGYLSGRGLQGIDVHSVGAITDGSNLVYPTINFYSKILKKASSNNK
ncbi:MAG: RHS repeat-associated core domain-containing protein [Bacteroidales bacterium]|nr:RHS repeat-associated core domain-containing protein [Bacteroidales bacterium]